MNFVKLSPRTVINMDQVLDIAFPIMQPGAVLTFATTTAQYSEGDGSLIDAGHTYTVHIEHMAEVEALARWLATHCDDMSVETGWGGWPESIYGPDPAKQLIGEKS